MENRVKEMISNLQSINNAGVRKTLYYGFIAEIIRENINTPVQIVRAKSIANILSKVPIVITDPELLVGSMIGLCPLYEKTLIKAEQEEIANKVISNYIYKKQSDESINAGKKHSEDSIRTFEDDFTNKKSRWALMSRVHHDSNVTYDDLQNLIDIMEKKYCLKSNNIDKYEIGRELERAFKIDYGEDKKLVDGLPWFVANHLNLDYSTLLNLGIKTFKDKIFELKESNKNDSAKLEYYEAALIVINAISLFFERCSEYLIQYSKDERHSYKRKEELQYLSTICKKLVTNKPETFYEAIQMLWTLHLIAHLCGGSALSLGRIDQYMNKFFAKDIDNEVISHEFAKELVCNLWIKTNEPKMRTVQSITLGGITPNGENAFTTFSKLCLDAIREVKMPYPNTGLRINKKNPDDIWNYAIDTIKAGTGQPMILNDSVWINNLMKLGYPEKDANDYYNMGCVEIMIPGKLPNWGVTEAIAFPMVLEGTFSKIKKESLKVNTFDDFMKVYKEEIYNAIKRDVEEANNKKKSQNSKCFDPYSSLLIDSCVEKGSDMFRNGCIYPAHWSIYAYGLGTVSDSLCVIKKAVFDENIISLNELDKVLLDNFEDHEDLRQVFFKNYPKFGNDDEEVDTIANNVLDYLNQKVFDLNKGLEKDKFVSTLFGYFFHIYHGEITGATPNGRLKGEPFSDSMGPSQGKDVKGPTCLFNSTLFLNNNLVTGGYALNLKINPSLLKDKQGDMALKNLLLAYIQDGGPQVQVYTTSIEDLKDAQIHPEKHTDLIVRVGGYCEYFVNLDKSLQNEIITRTLHNY